MGVRINNTVSIDWYRYLYLFMIIIYAGMSTLAVGGLTYFTGDIVGFLVPIIMTVILLNRHRVDFGNRNYLIALSVLSIWFVLQYFAKKGQVNLSLTLYHYYQLTMALIVIQVFRDKLFWVYEDIVYRLCILSLFLLGIVVIMPNAMASFLHLFNNAKPNFSEGSILVFTMGVLSRTENLYRNYGFAWEPGRFACFICLAIFCNFMIRGFSLKNNRHLWIFVVTLLTTQSTTGVFTLMALMVIFVMNKKNIRKALWLIVLIPAALYLYSLDFAQGKLEISMERATTVMEHTEYEGREGYSLDRIESLIMEWENFKHDPILGYCEPRNSFYEQNVASNFFSNNGTMQIFSKYGVILGLLIYLCIFYSSKRIARYFNDKLSISYLLIFVCISMSYIFTNIVLVMAFSYWGLFMPDRSTIERRR